MTNSLDFKKLLGIASESYPRLENVMIVEWLVGHV